MAAQPIARTLQTCLPVETASLPKLGRKQVTDINRLYGTGSFCHRSLSLSWQRTTTDLPITYWCVFVCKDHKLQLGFAGDIVGVSHAPFNWHDYDEDLAKIAWCASFEPVIELFQDFFRCDWLLQDIVSYEPELQSFSRRESLQAGFEIRKENQLLALGVAQFPQTLMKRIPQHDDRAQAAKHWLNLAIRIPCVIEAFGVSVQEMRKLRPGCFIRLNASALETVVLDSKPPLLATVDGTQLRIVSRYGPCTQNHAQETTPMPDVIDTTQTEEPQTQPVDTSNSDPISIDDLPITLRFEAGSMTLPLSQLGRLKPGFVFELETPLDQRVINVMANDALIAQGELVCVDDLVGVRVTGLCTNLQP